MATSTLSGQIVNYPQLLVCQDIYYRFLSFKNVIEMSCEEAPKNAHLKIYFSIPI